MVPCDGLLVLLPLMFDEAEGGVGGAGAGVEVDDLAEARVRFGEHPGETPKGGCQCHG